MMDRRISPTQKKMWLHKLCVLSSCVQFHSLQSFSASQLLIQKEILIYFRKKPLTLCDGSTVFSLEVLPEEPARLMCLVPLT